MDTETVWPWLSGLYNYAWFVGIFVSGITYLLMMKRIVISQTEKNQDEKKILKNTITQL